jgi:hypothetical protein
MKPGDIQRIEVALGIALPSSYAASMVPFPIPALEGNSDTGFWDDVDALIALNVELREPEGSRGPWPKRFFALGRDAGGCSDAIDLDDPEFGVFWFDRQHIDLAPDQRSEEAVNRWILRQTRDLTSDLAGDGFDPHGTPESLKATQDAKVKSGFSGCLIAVFVAIALIAIGILIGKRH